MMKMAHQDTQLVSRTHLSGVRLWIYFLLHWHCFSYLRYYDTALKCTIILWVSCQYLSFISCHHQTSGLRYCNPENVLVEILVCRSYQATSGQSKSRRLKGSLWLLFSISGKKEKRKKKERRTHLNQQSWMSEETELQEA
jgi:hypothetical protein